MKKIDYLIFSSLHTLALSNFVAWGLLDYQHSSWIINLVNLAYKPLSPLCLV